MAEVADAAVVGSAIVQTIADNLTPDGNATPELVEKVLDFTRELSERRGKAPRARLPNRTPMRDDCELALRIRPTQNQSPCRKATMFPTTSGTNAPPASRCSSTVSWKKTSMSAMPAGITCGSMPAQRLELLFDDGAYTRIDLPAVTADPLKFRDSRRYTDRLKDSTGKIRANARPSSWPMARSGGQQPSVAHSISRSWVAPWVRPGWPASRRRRCRAGATRRR